MRLIPPPTALSAGARPDNGVAQTSPGPDASCVSRRNIHARPANCYAQTPKTLHARLETRAPQLSARGKR
eukprot:6984132-Lingulodinium_polyedra.AAC.1